MLTNFILLNCIAVLGRVQLFLPQLKDADRQLKERLRSHDLDDLDIENVEEGEPCVEMVTAIMAILTQSKDPYTLLCH